MRTFPNRALTDAEAKAALADACKQVETNLPLYTWQCQNHSSVNGIYPGCPIAPHRRRPLQKGGPGPGRQL